ncbi:tetratricopeptide repeat protein [Aureimonas sp. AU20]|uniref:tetratricopeptide repeat protein n=1 Tax=Aureimonas sp. AU20 TaxID=1349819 RepID=UPI00071F69DF|nr:tetratricopeptide repeat protein [Aureimonas sp. AU20]ALN74128.1 hypothetical protein M673_15480 [Aureimonas sp. AU20]
MSNDIFIREVNEELRQERVRALWIRYGRIALALAVLIVLAVGGYVLWQHHQQGLQAADGDRLLAATSLLEDGKTQEGRAILETLSQSGVASYPALARMRLAQLDLATEPAKAIAGFDAIAGDAGVAQDLRDMAALRAAYVLVDNGSLGDVRARAERLATDGEPLRYGAREAIGLAAWKAGDFETARGFFTQLQEDFGTPAGIKRRAGLMVELIEAEHGPKGGTAPAAATPAATAAPDAAEVSETPAAPEPAASAPAPATAEPAAAPIPAAPATEPAPAAPAANQPPA